MKVKRDLLQIDPDLYNALNYIVLLNDLPIEYEGHGYFSSTFGSTFFETFKPQADGLYYCKPLNALMYTGELRNGLRLQIQTAAPQMKLDGSK